MQYLDQKPIFGKKPSGTGTRNGKSNSTVITKGTKAPAPKPKMATLADVRDKPEGSDPIHVIKNPNSMKKDSKKPAVPSRNEKPKTGPILSRMPRMIGQTIDPKRWRCNICSFLNDIEVKACTTCDSAKGEKKQKH